jgi:MA3 domain
VDDLVEAMDDARLSAGEEDPVMPALPRKEVHPVMPALPRKEVDEYRVVVRDFFLSGDLEEAARSVEALSRPAAESHPKFIRRLLTMSMEYNAYERELAAQLISQLYNDVISPGRITEGYQWTLDMLADIHIDVPLASDMLARFLARAVADDVLAPKFLEQGAEEEPKTEEGAEERRERQLAGEALNVARGMVKAPHFGPRLAHIFGPGDLTSVKRLRSEVDNILMEYLNTSDLKEAAACLKALHADSFHARFVERLVKRGIELDDDARRALVDLLRVFASAGILTTDHIATGILFCQRSVDDLKLDVPTADTLLASFIARAVSEKWIHPVAAVSTDQSTKTE